MWGWKTGSIRMASMDVGRWHRKWRVEDAVSVVSPSHADKGIQAAVLTSQTNQEDREVIIWRDGEMIQPWHHVAVGLVEFLTMWIRLRHQELEVWELWLWGLRVGGFRIWTCRWLKLGRELEGYDSEMTQRLKEMRLTQRLQDLEYWSRLWV